jgi:hypothetical protein
MAGSHDNHIKVVLEIELDGAIDSSNSHGKFGAQIKAYRNFDTSGRGLGFAMGLIRGSFRRSDGDQILMRFPGAFPRIF